MEHLNALDPEAFDKHGFKQPDMEPPELDPGSDAGWIAWNFLHPFRPNTGFGPGPIPLTEIRAYLELRDVPREYHLELVRQIRIIDQEYLQWCAEMKK